MHRETSLSWKRTTVAAITILIVTALTLGLCASQAQAMTLENPKASVAVVYL